MDKAISDERVSSLKNEFFQGFIKTCGINLISLERGLAESKLEITEAYTQHDGFVHAGVMATMADHTAGYAAFSVVSEDFRILTLEFKINFLRPATGDRLVCRARVIKQGKKVLVADSEVYDQSEGAENLVAKALVTLVAVSVEEFIKR